jgi:hypothetical protein
MVIFTRPEVFNLPRHIPVDPKQWHPDGIIIAANERMTIKPRKVPNVAATTGFECHNLRH